MTAPDCGLDGMSERVGRGFEAIVGVRLPSEAALAARIHSSAVRRRRRRTWHTIIVCFVAVTMVFGGYNLLVMDSPDGKCWRFSNYNCFDLSPEFITRATGVALPPGTVVRDSTTSAWLSWWLEATVVLPRNEKLPPQHGLQHGNVTFAGHSAGRLAYKISAVEDGGDWPVP